MGVFLCCGRTRTAGSISFRPESAKRDRSAELMHASAKRESLSVCAHQKIPFALRTGFFYPSRRLGISSTTALPWLYIITRSVYIITATPCIKALRLDDNSNDCVGQGQALAALEFCTHLWRACRGRRPRRPTLTRRAQPPAIRRASPCPTLSQMLPHNNPSCQQKPSNSKSGTHRNL